MIGRIRLPEVCANLTFGGAKRNRLFMAAGQSLYAVYVNTQGAAPHEDSGCSAAEHSQQSRRSASVEDVEARCTKPKSPLGRARKRHAGIV
jgi:hypothetical protein